MRKVVLVGFIILLAGCDSIKEKRKVYVRDRGEDYRHSQIIPPLEVPGYLSQYHSEVFPLPKGVSSADKVENISLKPPGFGEAL